MGHLLRPNRLPMVTALWFLLGTSMSLASAQSGGIPRGNGGMGGGMQQQREEMRHRLEQEKQRRQQNPPPPAPTEPMPTAPPTLTLEGDPANLSQPLVLKVAGMPNAICVVIFNLVSPTFQVPAANAAQPYVRLPGAVTKMARIGGNGVLRIDIPRASQLLGKRMIIQAMLKNQPPATLDIAFPAAAR